MVDIVADELGAVYLAHRCGFLLAFLEESFVVATTRRFVRAVSLLSQALQLKLMSFALKV